MITKIIVDSSKTVQFFRCEKGIFKAIEHFGLYYRVIDLAYERFFEKEIENTSLLILGQEGIGFSLSSAEVDIILRNLHMGMGLVIFDGYLTSYPENFLRNLRFRNFVSKKLSKIKLEKSSFLCQGTYYDEVELKSETIFYAVDFDKRIWNPFIYNEENEICGVYGRLGKGKSVIFFVSAGLWQDDVLGHAEGLDDLFFRCLIWASKKPFITKTMPPFVTCRIDDVSGSENKIAKYRETVNNLKYLDILNKYGFCPNVGLFIDDIGESDKRIIREKYFERQAEFSPHAFSDPNNINEFPIYMKHNGEEFTEEILRENFKRVDKKFEEFGIRPSITVNAHFGEIGLKSLPYLKERGQRFLMNIIRVGKAYSDIKSTQWELKPYGRIDFSLSEIPEDRDFMNILSLPFSIEEKFNNYKRADFDFLYKCTEFLNENEKPDLKRAIRRGIFQIKRGLENKFFGCLMTHEQRISFFKLEQWEEIIRSIVNEIKKEKVIFKSYDYISSYSKNWLSILIEKIEFSENLQITLKGKSNLPIYLYLFYEKDDRVDSNFLEIPAFENSIILHFKV